MSLPIIERVSAQNPACRLFECFLNRPFPFFLDSAMQHGRYGRFSFMGSDPFLVFSSRSNRITLTGPECSSSTTSGNPFDVLRRLMEDYRLQVDVKPAPLPGGAVGYFSYDLCHFIEELPNRAADDLGLPECTLGFYDCIVAFDHQDNSIWIISSGLPETGIPARARRARARLAQFKALMKTLPVFNFRPGNKTPSKGEGQLESNFTREEYLRAVERARQYIIEGDIFEVNLSQRFRTSLASHPFTLYRHLRSINPAPFACYMDFRDFQIISSSPERFLKLTGNMVETRPIKGTRPRGSTPAEDTRMAKQLSSSIKDIAENTMIVDLERNDLGRVCRYGSIKVDELAALEAFPTVFHLTSTISGALRKGTGSIDLLKATFPGGSITGAPKVRAMEIIDELEPTRRSIYTGSIGYLGFDGDLDLNIAIRTCLAKGERVFFQAGGAITFDSDARSEYDETMHKARALITAIEMTATGTTADGTGNR